jgi:hypothetical protein
MRLSTTASLALLMVACSGPPVPQLPTNAELLDENDAVTSGLSGNEYKIVRQGRPGRDDAIVVAIQQRTLTREQLRATALRLAGRAKKPTIDFYASESVYEACTRDKFASIRQQSDPADQRACSSGTIYRMGVTEPRVLYWGSAAPK